MKRIDLIAAILHLRREEDVIRNIIYSYIAMMNIEEVLSKLCESLEGLLVYYNEVISFR